MFEVKWLLIKCAAGVFARKVVEPGGSRTGAALGAPLPAVWPGLEAAVALVEPGTCHVSLALHSPRALATVTQGLKDCHQQ